MPRSQNVGSIVARLSLCGLGKNGCLCDGFFPQLRGGTVMLREMFGLALLSVVVASTALAKPPAGDPPPPSHIYRFAGFSTGTERGGAGIPAMHATCQVDFGDSARMCTLEEYFLSPNAEQSDSKAWVQPTAGFLPEYSKSCAFWSSASSAGVGTAIDEGSGGVLNFSCSSSLTITCCTPLQ